jgi:nitrate/TMAO reductase-like tetraheme cytochrome c subunit
MAADTIKRKYYLFFIAGGISAILILVLTNKTIEYTSTNEFCNACHVHPHADASWKLSVHNNTRTGISVRCVECHLPPEEQTARFLTRKVYHGFHDFYVYITRDADDIDWVAK